MKKASINLPNTLSIIRVCLVPLFVFSLIFMHDIKIWGSIVPALIYIATAITDMLDGKIARKYNLVTDFGKFIDPLADKFMVLSAFVSILVWLSLIGKTTLAMIFLPVALIILLRELGVTTLRLVVAGKANIVVAASMLGKIKTVTQIVATVVLIVEPAISDILPFWNDVSFLAFITDNSILSYVAMAVMTFTTVYSGIDYLKAYLPYINTNK